MDARPWPIRVAKATWHGLDRLRRFLHLTGGKSHFVLQSVLDLGKGVIASPFNPPNVISAMMGVHHVKPQQMLQQKPGSKTSL